jgi:cytidine deaminase
MEKNEYQFFFETYNSLAELDPAESALLIEARKMILNAYAPYSNFKVGAAAELINSRVVGGSNQENASFPAGICAERVLLSAVSFLYPGIPIRRIAISYQNAKGNSDHPIFPCGVCRQSLVEYEQRVKQPIRLILGGEAGKVIVIPKASQLLPLAFTGEEIQ